jgi:hypothetical protein
MGQPIALEWAGWSTNTLRLQQYGWEISAHQDPSMREMGIAIRHRQHQVEGLTRIEEWDYQRMRFEERHDIKLPINLAHRLHLQLPWSLPGGPMDWRAVDARPHVVSYCGEPMPKGFEDLFHFRPAFEAPRQIILPHDESIDELLDKIMKKQEGAKQAYFEEKVRREHNAGPVPTLHAQILSFPQRSAA